jgi:hypothetical protein
MSFFPRSLRQPPPQVPTIGEPLVIHSWFPTVSIGCKCNPTSPVPLLIVGNEHIVECPSCKSHYRVGRVSMDLQTNEASIAIARVVKRDPDAQVNLQ